MFYIYVYMIISCLLEIYLSGYLYVFSVQLRIIVSFIFRIFSLQYVIFFFVEEYFVLVFRYVEINL